MGGETDITRWGLDVLEASYSDANRKPASAPALGPDAVGPSAPALHNYDRTGSYTQDKRMPSVPATQGYGPAVLKPGWSSVVVPPGDGKRPEDSPSRHPQVLASTTLTAGTSDGAMHSLDQPPGSRRDLGRRRPVGVPRPAPEAAAAPNPYPAVASGGLPPGDSRNTGAPLLRAGGGTTYPSGGLPLEVDGAGRPVLNLDPGSIGPPIIYEHPGLRRRSEDPQILATWRPLEARPSQGPTGAPGPSARAPEAAAVASLEDSRPAAAPGGGAARRAEDLSLYQSGLGGGHREWERDREQLRNPLAFLQQQSQQQQQLLRQQQELLQEQRHHLAQQQQQQQQQRGGGGTPNPVENDQIIAQMLQDDYDRRAGVQFPPPPPPPFPGHGAGLPSQSPTFLPPSHGPQPSVESDHAIAAVIQEAIAIDPHAPVDISELRGPDPLPARPPGGSAAAPQAPPGGGVYYTTLEDLAFASTQGGERAAAAAGSAVESGPPDGREGGGMEEQDRQLALKLGAEDLEGMVLVASPNGAVSRRLSRIESIPVRHEMRMNSGELPTPEYAMSDHERLTERLYTYGLRERHIAGDGNCQFRALSDQLFGNPEKHAQVRKAVVAQLKKHPEVYGQYAMEKYGDYVKKMAKNGEWGDHITLQAAADVWGMKISLMTSFKDKYLIEIMPREPKVPRGELWLSFWAEVHYNSIYAVEDTPAYVSSGEPRKKKHWLF